MDSVTFGLSKLEFLHVTLDINEKVHELGIDPTDTDADEVINHAKRRNSYRPSVEKEILILINTFFPRYQFGHCTQEVQDSHLA